MKRIVKTICKLVLLILLILTSNISIYAQDTENITLPDVFPTEDAVWVIEVEEIWSGLYDENYIGCFPTTYYLLGDTIIENKKYSKLYSIYGELDSLKVKSCDFYTENQLYVGAIRVEGEKVYLRPYEVIYCFGEEMCPHIDFLEYGYPYYKDEEIDYSFYDKDILMYNFSVEESEQHLYIDNYPSSCIHFLAYGIYFNSDKNSLIRGIGSTIGLWFNNFSVPIQGLQIWRNLHSFYYKGKQFYPTEESGINESIADTPKTKAYVSNGVLNIENIEGINSVVVYDIMGRVITSVNANGATSTQITLPSTIKGAIIVKVNNEVVKVLVN